MLLMNYFVMLSYSGLRAESIHLKPQRVNIKKFNKGCYYHNQQ